MNQYPSKTFWLSMSEISSKFVMIQFVDSTLILFPCEMRKDPKWHLKLQYYYSVKLFETAAETEKYPALLDEN